MLSVCVLSQLLVSAHFIAVPTNNENSNFSSIVCAFFSS